VEIKITVDEAMAGVEVAITGNDIEQMTAIAKQIQNKKVETNKLVVKTGDGIQVVTQSDVLFVESFGNELSMTCNNKQTLVTRKTLKQFLAGDTARLFVQISKSMAINMNALIRMEVAFSGNYYAFLTDETRVTVSRRFIKGILKRLEGSTEDEIL